MRAYLKVKIKSLAAEARIIRLEEQRIAFRKATRDELEARKGKAMGFAARTHNAADSIGIPTIKYTTRILATRSDKNQSIWWGLNRHRREDVRAEARAAQLAYAYLRGRHYWQVEDPRKTTKKIDYNRVATNLVKFGYVDRPAALKYLEVWVKASKEMVKNNEVPPTVTLCDGPIPVVDAPVNADARL